LNEHLLVALPKGRILEQALALLERAGIRTRDIVNGSRRLTFPDEAGQYEFVFLKPVDIPVYVESGTVDAGIVGSDILREVEPDVYEPLDLRFGLCRLVVAAPEGIEPTTGRVLRVATKYPRSAERHFWTRNIQVHIIRLDGSVEIAPQLGLSDAVVDLVETGRTLRENGMRIVEDIEPVSAKLIVNRTAMKTRSDAVRTLIHQLDMVVYANP
jgi:ATP phosphoribosyltransferase